MNSERTFFVTTVTAHRRPIFRNGSNAELLIKTLAHYREQGRFLLHEFVIMPDHVHLLLTPAPEISLERAMQFIKGGFSYRLNYNGPVWQASFTNHRVRDLEDYERHCDYIRMNPVHARLVRKPQDYSYSSAAGALRTDPIPQGLKPGSYENAQRGPEGPLFHLHRSRPLEKLAASVTLPLRPRVVKADHRPGANEEPKFTGSLKPTVIMSPKQ